MFLSYYVCGYLLQQLRETNPNSMDGTAGMAVTGRETEGDLELERGSKSVSILKGRRVWGYRPQRPRAQLTAPLRDGCASRRSLTPRYWKACWVKATAAGLTRLYSRSGTDTSNGDSLTLSQKVPGIVGMRKSTSARHTAEWLVHIGAPEVCPLFNSWAVAREQETYPHPPTYTHSSEMRKILSHSRFLNKTKPWEKNFYPNFKD